MKKVRSRRVILLKSEEEIRKEIQATYKAIENYRNAYKNKKIPKDVLEYQLTDCLATIDALKWVLGENDRYD